VRKTLKEIGRNMRNILSDNRLDIFVHTCRIASSAGSLKVERKLFAQCTSVRPFNKILKVLSAKTMGNFKSIPTIFSLKVLIVLSLQQINHKLTGQ